MTKRVIVIGAGLAGLACAFELRRRGCEVLVLEASARAGGVVGTSEQRGFLFEHGPNTVPSGALEFRRLVEELSLGARLITSSRRQRTRWLWFRDRLVALPGSPLALLWTPLLSWRAKLRVSSEVLRRWRAPQADAPEPTLAEFLGERLGDEAARVLAGAFVRGVYAAELDELGARSAFPRLWNAAREHGGLVRAALRGRKRAKPTAPGPRVSPFTLLSFPRGQQELVDALAQALGPALHLDCAVESIEPCAGAGWRVRARGCEPLEARAVVLATPAPGAARLLASRIDNSSLLAIAHADVCVVHLGFAALELPNGFGFLVSPHPRTHGARTPAVLGAIFASNLFEARTPPGAASVSMFVRGDEVRGLDDGELAARCAGELAFALHLAHAPEPIAHAVHRWSGVIPRYAPGHLERIDRLRAQLATRTPGISLAGSYVRGVSVDDVIASGRAAAREVGGPNGRL